ncbi:putative quinol monooxygenase [Mucilaginibacter agri]|uniref:Antibiotic biosynthesis monooxygenase n=1 Tax=Mucilaginibacter agri TaxID=2695265 RepID=A0A966DUL9_9SPHI|nr:putative quinol monooxygenase [Mucilaginibacter agri]NCD70586.1 antibiotic biosynthesis monooxygenase [Mucilaginibacter agri]
MENKNITLASFKSLLVLITFTMTLFAFGKASAQNKDLIVRVAKLQIDSAQLDSYNAALKEHAETAVRVEPGVITLYAVAEKENPTHIMVFEIYANAAAYQAHLQAPHFKKYKEVTKNMVKSLQLVETDPIVLAAKPKL